MRDVVQFFASKPDIAMFFYITVLVMVLIYWNKIPSIYAMKQAVSMLNDRGGNIFVLTMLTLLFFTSTMRLFYYALEMLKYKQLTPDNAVLLMAIQMCSATAFGGSFGALLKTMTGSDSLARGGEQQNVPGGPAVTRTEKSAVEVVSTSLPKPANAAAEPKGETP